MTETGLKNYNPCSEYRPKVLIAQADQESLDTIVLHCNKYDKFDIVTATTGQQIIDEVNKSCFDALVLGLKFSDITGATLAYLVHHFDPLVSVAFLSSYTNDILVAGTQDLGFVFWSKAEKLKDLDLLCDDIYNLAMTIPCRDSMRSLERKNMQSVREEYLKYQKLILPNSLMQVLEERKKKVGLYYVR